MVKHKYCCQNVMQDFYDHIIKIPDNLEIKPVCLYDLNEKDFLNGLTELTESIKNIYADMIKNPVEYGLPLAEDIEYTPFNPKAAESKNSAHRLVALLHVIVNCGELVGCVLNTNEKELSDGLKKLNSVNKISNSKMLFKKIKDFGFTYNDGVFSYLDNNYVIPALYGFMKNTALNNDAVFSLNCFLAAANPPNHKNIFIEYLAGDERIFCKLLNDFMDCEGFVMGNESDYRNFMYSLEYWIDSKNKKRIIRLHSEYGKLCVSMKLHNSDCYDYYTENLPDNIKQIFRKESSCRNCKEPCSYRLYRTFEGISYTDCGYGNWFNVTEYNLDDIKYYKQLILLEAKAVKTNARKKGQKVYNN
ncbi:MAG: hypothetical protein FWE82_01470 [Defluviitaleaceae bacterium]|nr:hypothetical protein [Defluviitaleaceae bacterium]